MSIRAKPMHIFCKLIGVAPYSFDLGTSTTKFRTSKLGTIYSSFVATLLTWFAILNYKTMYCKQNSESYVTVGAQWLQFYVNNGFSVLMIAANSLQQWKIIKVLNALSDTENRNPKEIPDHGKLRTDIFYGIAIVAIAIFFHLLTTLTSYFDNENMIDYYWFPYGILFLLNTSVVLQFLYGVVKIGTKFRALNLRLEDSIGMGQAIMAEDIKNTKTIEIELNKAGEEHLELIDVTNLLISAFSYQLLLCFVAALIIPVSGLYLICKRIIQYVIDKTILSYDVGERNYNWWCLTCYPLLHSILLGSIISVCNWTMNQATLLDGTLPRLQRVFRLSAMNSNIGGFSQQLLLQRISFHVFHLFTINPSMVCSIISTVLTYLIILVQFEITQDIEKTLQADAFNSAADDHVNFSQAEVRVKMNVFESNYSQPSQIRMTPIYHP